MIKYLLLSLLLCLSCDDRPYKSVTKMKSLFVERKHLSMESVICDGNEIYFYFFVQTKENNQVKCVCNPEYVDCSFD